MPLSFYFHEVLQHLKTFIYTNFRFQRVLRFPIEDAWISRLLHDTAFKADGGCRDLFILGDPARPVSRAGEKARRKFSSTGGKAPGYRLSSDHFQMVKRMLVPDWVQKMLCIVVPNWRTASPEFFSWVRTRPPIISRHLPGSFTKLS